MLLSELPTPALILDRSVLARNLRAMSDRMRNLGVNLRPHMKTAKSKKIGKLATDGHSGGITVSTLREAQHFADHNFRDITYAIGITPDKLAVVSRIQESGTRLNLLTDDVGVAQAIINATHSKNEYSVLIDVDTGYHRSGVLPESDTLLAIAQTLNDAPHVHLAGVLTHAGHSYEALDSGAIARIAEEERAGAVTAAERIRDAGIACPSVSVGSTPTMQFAENLDGVTEGRPGNYMFYDLSMVGRGVCELDHIAVSVLTEVIVNLPDRDRVLIDAGALAMSHDRSADSGGMSGVGFGMVCNLKGQPMESFVVKKASQEHGWLGMCDDESRLPLQKFPIGSRWRVLPNHSCMTCAAYDNYYVVNGGNEVVDVWPRVNGWDTGSGR